MSSTSIFSTRTRRALSPHGYEGRRAEPRFRAPVLPEPAPAALPAAEDLARRGLSFEPVGLAAGPVRLLLKGRALGVFITREAAAGLIKTLALCLVFALIAVSGAGATHAEENARLLHAIVITEDWRGRVGRAGEIGPFQMLPATRADRLAEFRAHGETAPSERAIAAAHLEWLRRRLRRAGVDPVPFNLALCWNAGFDRATAGAAPLSSYRYACQVRDLVEAPLP